MKTPFDGLITRAVYRGYTQRTLHKNTYNSAVVLASMGAEIKSPPGNGPYYFRIHGQIYHIVSPL
jgi:hypothetical protein